MKTSLWFICLILILNTACKNESVGLEQEANESGALLKRTLLFSSVDEKNPIAITEEFEYDSQGRLSKTSSPLYENGTVKGVSQFNLYEYNSAGQLVRISNFNANINAGFLNLKNQLFTYFANGLKEKESVEYPQINSSEYTHYFYQGNKLIKAEKYNNKGNLENYTEYKYSGNNLTNETLYTAAGEVNTITNYSYQNGLNTKTEVYRGNNGTVKLREITKTFDSNGNLIILQSKELAAYSSASSFVLKYEYYH
jgi:hypothetical protein